MRLLQLLTLALLATAARADFFFTGDATVIGSGEHDDSSCSIFGPTAQIFAVCSPSITYGDVSLLLVASGSDFGVGFDGWGAENEATVGFTDQITFYGAGKTGVVLWDVSFDQEGESIFSVRDLPSAVTFGVPYTMSLGLTGFDAAIADSTHSQFGDIKINGFQVLSPVDPGCDISFPDASCGPPIDVGIRTASGFLYGGTATIPEPSALLLLATAAGMALLVSRSRRTA
jgi:hypothetical protein